MRVGLQLFKNSIDAQEKLRLNLHALIECEWAFRIRAYGLYLYFIVIFSKLLKRSLLWDFVHLMNFKYNISADVFDNLALTISISFKLLSFKTFWLILSSVKTNFRSLPHFLVNYNNLSQQILSLHILHFITAHFTFYHCTN
jgi:hypothetical protein